MSLMESPENEHLIYEQPGKARVTLMKLRVILMGAKPCIRTAIFKPRTPFPESCWVAQEVIVLKEGCLYVNIGKVL